ncbi:MAG: pyruvate carboxylase subunit B, partial [Deltaproteobacteria bacterium]|nr:pyruvate carboxylase subunit B [Deltaproteobacteria bacterium]
MTEKKIQITETVLRDAHQSLLATRMRTEDMLPIAEKLDRVGFWSVEMWGGATFDTCLRYLRECPWERLRLIRRAMPKTRMQMLLRGQNVVGYHNYPDDVVEHFVEKAADNGIDVFRVFDAMNDVRNMKTAFEAVKKTGKVLEASLCYTISPVHTVDYF